ncbi:glycosyltransferase family 2 protein [Mucilaginibacter sp.]|jgi:glycosyltransferase involved in cell wall biosynthesis|uniref:glycosyltransferase family 2 protein n=1 Tax=Mucilaginibacter sp. TaxID=1882438 RepID=UPI00356B2ED5
MTGECPLISIVTVVYNAVKTIEQTIQSVLQQSYNNIEYIIIDGGSTDGTVKLVKEYKQLFAQKGRKYKFVSESDNGIYDAMNKGIALSTGDWIGIINSDDFYEKNAIQYVVNTIASNPSAELIHGNLNFIDEVGNVKFEIPKEDLNLLTNTMTIFHPTIFIKKQVYEKFGLFNLKYKLCADWDLVLRLYMERINFCYLNELLANFKNGGAGSGFKLIHLTERYKIRHTYKNKSRLRFDLKDILVYLYFRIHYNKTSM